MKGRRVALTVCTVAALIFGASVAPSAAASGTTVFTCVKTLEGSFKGAHCLEGAGGERYEHVKSNPNTETEFTVTNSNTTEETSAARQTIIHETIAGAELELRATTVNGEGTVQNREEGAEMWFEGSGTIKYTGVTVAKPAGKGCKVFTDTPEKTKGAEGAIDVSVKATSRGQGDFAKFEPASGTTFSTFFVECTTKVAALEGTWEITGSFKCPASGATIVCSGKEVTEQGTLKGKGAKMGLDGAFTFAGKDPDLPADTECKPLTTTTVP
jgi:hypothetical protein